MSHNDVSAYWWFSEMTLERLYFPPFVLEEPKRRGYGLPSLKRMKSTRKSTFGIFL